MYKVLFKHANLTYGFQIGIFNNSILRNLLNWAKNANFVTRYYIWFTYEMRF